MIFKKCRKPLFYAGFRIFLEKVLHPKMIVLHPKMTKLHPKMIILHPKMILITLLRHKIKYYFFQVIQYLAPLRVHPKMILLFFMFLFSACLGFNCFLPCGNSCKFRRFNSFPLCAVFFRLCGYLYISFRKVPV